MYPFPWVKVKPKLWQSTEIDHNQIIHVKSQYTSSCKILGNSNWSFSGKLSESTNSNRFITQENFCCWSLFISNQNEGPFILMLSGIHLETLIGPNSQSLRSIKIIKNEQTMTQISLLQMLAIIELHGNLWLFQSCVFRQMALNWYGRTTRWPSRQKDVEKKVRVGWMDKCT